MKRLILLCIVGLAIGCEDDISIVPDPNNPSGITPDYRDEWAGAYHGERTNATWGAAGSSSTTLEDSVLVTLLGDSSLTIVQTEIAIDSLGNGFIDNGPGNFYRCRFYATDSLEIETRSGGLGGGFTSVFKGEKQ